MRLGRAWAVLGAVIASALGAAVLAVSGAGGAAAQSSAPVRFIDASPQVIEGRGPVRVVVERTDLPVSRLLVHYRTEDGGDGSSTDGAAAGSDYVHTAGTLVFEVGVQSSSFTVIVRNDDISEGTEHLRLHLATSSGSGEPARLTILDDDVAPPPPSSPASPPASATGRSAEAGSTSAPPPPVVVASSAGARRPVAAPRTRSRATTSRPAPPRRIILQQTPATPFELRPSPDAGAPSGSTVVDPLLALGAGLLLARVAAEAWFRARIAAG